MEEINLDHAAQAPLFPEALDAMEAILKSPAANPSSSHAGGMEARERVEKARGFVADLIGAKPREIIFTSSGTESNNLALKGLALHPRRKGGHMVVSAIEHFSVINAARALMSLGIEVTELGVDPSGLVDPDELKNALKDDTFLVSIMHANNEIGTVQNLKELVAVAKEHGCLFHSDGVGAAGRLETDVGELGVDLYSIAASPLYGPQGAAALYIKRGVALSPLLHGGVQERGLRSGTENTAAIAGMGEAARIVAPMVKNEAVRLTGLSEKLIEGVLAAVPETTLTGHRFRRIPGHASFVVSYVEGEAMLISLMMEGLVAASGSSCTAKDLKISHVLRAIGLDHADAQGSVVFTLGRENTEAHVRKVLEAMPPAVERLRAMSPLYKKAR